MDLRREMIRAFEERPDKSKKELAARLGRTPATVTEMLRDEKPRRIRADEVGIIRDYLELEPAARIVGHVGATSEEVYYASADDPAETVKLPPNGTESTVAVEIRGDSLGPGLNGWIAYYNDVREPVTPDLLGRLCVVGLPDGRVLIKIVKQAPGRRFHLLPNAGGEAILDQKVQWAARVIDLSPKSERQILDFPK